MPIGNGELRQLSSEDYNNLLSTEGILVNDDEKDANETNPSQPTENNDSGEEPKSGEEPNSGEPQDLEESLPESEKPIEDPIWDLLEQLLSFLPAPKKKAAIPLSGFFAFPADFW